MAVQPDATGTQPRTPLGDSASGNPSETPGGSSDWERRTAINNVAVALKVIYTCVLVIALTLQQVQFRDTWTRACDYNIKVWSTVWLGRTLLQHLVIHIPLLLAVMCSCPSSSRCPAVFQLLLVIFKLSWFLYGIQPVLVEERCDHVSGTWGLVLWWLDFAITLGPCICFCGLCVVWMCLYCLQRGGPSNVPLPTPADVRKKLRKVQYCEVQTFFEEENQRSIGESIPQNLTEDLPPRDDSQDALRHLPDIATTITGVPMPDMRQFRKLQSGLFGKDAASTTAILQPPPSVLGSRNKKTSVSCPICFCDFDPKDEVVQMPCDTRHVFHAECLFVWLNQSQQCPVCRSNVIESLKKEENQKAVHHTSENNSNCAAVNDSVV